LGDRSRIKKERSVEIEEVGIDLSSIDEEFLEELARIAEEEVRKVLEDVLGPRIVKYLLAVDVYVDDKLSVVLDLAVDSHVPPYISLESVIDRALKRGLDKAAAYVRSRAREIRRDATQEQDRDRINA